MLSIVLFLFNAAFAAHKLRPLPVFRAVIVGLWLAAAAVEVAFSGWYPLPLMLCALAVTALAAWQVANWRRSQRG